MWCEFLGKCNRKVGGLCGNERHKDCARYRAAEYIGIDKVPERVGPCNQEFVAGLIGEVIAERGC